MSYGTGPAPYGDQPAYGGQAPYGGPAPYPGGPAPYGAPSQFGQFGPPPLTPDIAPQPGASFGEAVKRFFQRYAQFSGYASRSEYWWVALFNALVGLGIYVLLFMVERWVVPQTMSGPVWVSGRSSSCFSPSPMR